MTTLSSADVNDHSGLALASAPGIELPFVDLQRQYRSIKEEVDTALIDSVASAEYILGVSKGDEVIAPANTFLATVLPVLHLGATPVLVDCDDETATINPASVSAAIGPRTVGVVAVHSYGHPSNMGPLQELCRRHKPVL